MSPGMLMITNMTIVFAVLMLLWGVISLTGVIATFLEKKAS
ncbi:MAG: OadG family protein [Negativicutes bacterium]|nr:OadG family protein [Negativicutes bacterium]